MADTSGRPRRELPLWAVFGLFAVGWFILRLVFMPLLGDDPAPWWASAIPALVFGAVLTGWTALSRRRIRARGLEPDQAQQLEKAVLRGKLPADEVLRGKAPEFARQARRTAKGVLAIYPSIFGAMAALCVYLWASGDKGESHLLGLAAVFLVICVAGLVLGVRMIWGANRVLLDERAGR